MLLTLRYESVGSKTGLDTLVVHAVNGVHLVWGELNPSVPELTR